MKKLKSGTINTTINYYHFHMGYIYKYYFKIFIFYQTTLSILSMTPMISIIQYLFPRGPLSLISHKELKIN